MKRDGRGSATALPNLYAHRFEVIKVEIIA